MKILLIAYKIEPNKGSEDGTGYHLTKALAQRQKDITLITRTNNVEKLKSDEAFKDIEIIGVDVPKAIGFFKRKQKGIILYYYLWQICVGLKVFFLQRKQKFDVIHQLNFHATWAAHFLFSKKARIVWGPLTHHQDIPSALWFGSFFSYVKKEKIKNFIKKLFWRIDPFLLWSVLRTDKILYSAQHIVWPYKAAKDKIVHMTYAGSVFPALDFREPLKKFNILFVGRLTPLKGSLLALSAVFDFIKDLSDEQRRSISVTIIGEGPDYTDVMAMAQIITSATGVQVEILPWLPQDDLQSYYQSASVFLYPSFEGQGLVIAEALANGCPILCFDQTGPDDLAGIAAVAVKREGSLNEVKFSFSLQLSKLFNEFTTNPGLYRQRIEASFVRAQELDWNKTAEKIIEAYHAGI